MTGVVVTGSDEVHVGRMARKGVAAGNNRVDDDTAGFRGYG